MGVEPRAGSSVANFQARPGTVIVPVVRSKLRSTHDLMAARLS